MDRVYKIIIGLSLLSLFSCGNSTKSTKEQSLQDSKKNSEYVKIKDGVLHFDLNKAKDHPKTIKLSEICDSLIYVPLETKKGCLLTTGMHKIVKDGDDLFIHYSHSLYHFNMKGKLVCQIGKTGRGPGEYLCGGFCVSKKNKRIYALSIYRHRILEFDYSGKLISDKVKINDYPCNIIYDDLTDNMISSHDYELSTRGSIDSVKYYLYKIRNLKGYITYTHKSNIFPKKDLKKPQTSLCYTGTYIHRYKSSFRFQEISNDTIYRINNSKLKPLYILNNKLFKKGVNYEDIETCFKNRGWNGKNFLYNRIIGESDRFIMFGSTGELFLYDKKENIFSCFSNNKNGDNEFLNDLDPIISGAPDIKNNYFLYTISANEFISNYENYKERLNNKVINSYTKRLDQIYNSISEDSNPILIFARLKK
ncbi:6-bladed beta-propeller [Marinilabiliaceae bacterium JC040]|nr:6-bladed beta-propeller [Marinilabiliaceae bacterium JC040]